jgi:hypothetical protein
VDTATYVIFAIAIGIVAVIALRELGRRRDDVRERERDPR